LGSGSANWAGCAAGDHGCRRAVGMNGLET
jgi:hypothetical protein